MAWTCGRALHHGIYVVRVALYYCEGEQRQCFYVDDFFNKEGKARIYRKCAYETISEENGDSLCKYPRLYARRDELGAEQVVVDCL